MSEDTIVNEEQLIDVPETTEEVIEVVPQPGEKTESALLLESLQEERRKRRELEAELERRNTNQTDEVFSEEGQVLKRELDSINEKLAFKDISDKYPQLKDKVSEFEDFRANPENKGMSVTTAARVFLAENNLLTTPQPRKGLETNSGGGRVIPKIGRTEEEIADLRVNNFRKYMKELKAGTLRK